MITSKLNFYSGRYRDCRQEQEPRRDSRLGCPPKRSEASRGTQEQTSALTRVGHDDSLLPVVVHVPNHVQILIQFYSNTQWTAPTIPTEHVRKLRITQILKVHNIALFGRLEHFGLRDRILRPIQKRPPSIGFLRRHRDRGLLRLVTNIHVFFWINLGSKRIDGRQRKESRRLDHSIPVNWICHRGISRRSQRIYSVVRSGFQRVHGYAMFVIPQSPHQNHTHQRQRGSHPAVRTSAPCANLFIDERKHRWNDQSKNQQNQHHGLNNKHDVPRIPPLRKWPERPDAVIICEIEQNVAESGKTGIEKKHAPSRRQIGIFCFPAPQPPYQIYESDHNRGIQWDAEERMREATMMFETNGRPPETANNVEIRRFGRQSQRERGQRRFAIEAGASHARAGQKVSQGFQAVI